ncbi:MAG TPA: Arm DNA-binding domain-containing protein, partial [Gemmatimonadaceae bacterium]
MPTQKITKRLLDSYPQSEGEVFIWDTDLAGFGVRVHPTGKRAFVFRCRPGGGRAAIQRKLTIGEYGSITVEQARREAQRLAGEIAAGRDPGAERDGRRAAKLASRDAPSVAELGTHFLDEVRTLLKQSTAKEYARMWRRSVVPGLGRMKVAEVTPSHVSKLHRQLRSTPYAANRVLALLGSFFAYAERHGARPKHSNPAHEVQSYPERQRERFLTPEEIARLGDALDRAEREGLPPAPTRRRNPKTGKTAKHRPKSADTPKPANPYAVAALRFLLLTGWREREALT